MTPASSRAEELSQLYRRIADMQVELADTQARFDRAVRSSAGADEMIGQMLARVADVEARLAAAQKQTGDAETQLGKARASQAELAERLRVTESRLHGEHDELDRVHVELEAARTEATVSIAAAEEAQDALLRERDTITVLRADLARAEAQLAREREERESLRARVKEFAAVCDERDDALAREEQLEAELLATRRELAEAKAQAAPVARSEEVERLRGVVAGMRRLLADLEEPIRAPS